MLQELENETKERLETVTISPNAVEAVREILNQRKLEGYSLRVYVAGGSCCGVNFGMALDNNVRQNDFTFQSEGIQVIIDDQSMPYLSGAKIDYINDPTHGAGFTVASTSNAKTGGCACGSEGHSHSEEGASCGCGGSCSCNN